MTISYVTIGGMVNFCRSSFAHCQTPTYNCTVLVKRTVSPRDVEDRRVAGAPRFEPMPLELPIEAPDRPPRSAPPSDSWGERPWGERPAQPIVIDGDDDSPAEGHVIVIDVA